jgi:F-type H+-transporting ATPase subunit b
MRVLRERDVMVTRTVDDNRKSAEQFAAAEADYERAMAEARKQASAIRDQARAEGRRILEEMRARARQESEAALQQAAEQLKRQSDEIAAGLRAALDSLSAALASRVLGVPVGAESSAKSSGTAATTVSGR